MSITGNYPSGARNRDRGASVETIEQAAEMQATSSDHEAERQARLQAHLRTLPSVVSGFTINPDNGEVTDHVGNYLFTVSIGDTFADIQAEIEAWFECC